MTLHGRAGPLPVGANLKRRMTGSDSSSLFFFFLNHQIRTCKPGTDILKAKSQMQNLPGSHKRVNHSADPHRRRAPTDNRTVGRLGFCMGLNTRPGSHILSILRMQTRTSPHMQSADPSLEKGVCRPPCLVTPTCPRLPLPTAACLRFPAPFFLFKA